MAKVRQKNTTPELALRHELFRRGLRYRINHVVLTKPRRVADIAFTRLKIAIFIDGCFWHGCPEHASWPKQNAEFWRKKIELNRARDADTVARLQKVRWNVVRVWSHESSALAAQRIEKLVMRMRALSEK